MLSVSIQTRSHPCRIWHYTDCLVIGIAGGSLCLHNRDTLQGRVLGISEGFLVLHSGGALQGVWDGVSWVHSSLVVSLSPSYDSVGSVQTLVTVPELILLSSQAMSLCHFLALRVSNVRSNGSSWTGSIERLCGMLLSSSMFWYA